MNNNTISEIIKNKENNFDLVRLKCAVLVIIGHAGTLAPHVPLQYKDIFYKFFGVHSSSIAVYIFFYLSGLLVCTSLIKNKNILSFIFSRFFRIYPALIVLMLMTIILGAIYTNIDFNQYILHPYTADYVINNLLLSPQYNLPGLFELNKYRGAVNGSLWTIHYEVVAYSVVVVFFIGGLFSRSISCIIMLVVFLEFFKLTNFIFPATGPAVYLAMYFSLGVVSAFYASFVYISCKLIIPLIFILLISKGTILAEFTLHIIFILISLLIAKNKMLLRLRPKYDISYGVYLYGFLIAQILTLVFPDIKLTYHILLTIIISFAMGFLSSYLIELPMINFGKIISNKILKYDNLTLIRYFK